MMRQISNFLCTIPDFASGWDFSGYRPRFRGFGIGIFDFGLDRKIPKSLGSGSGHENLKKFRELNPQKSQNPEDFEKSPGLMRNPRDSGFFSEFLPSGYPDRKPPLV